MRQTTITFSQRERYDLLRAWAAISVAIAIVYTGLAAGFDLLIAIAAAGVTAGLGFLLHELAHKVVAIRHGCSAEFRAQTMMLWLALITALFGFVFAAPGAVMVRGAQSTRESGLISAAGPATNAVLAAAFLAVHVLVPAGPWNILLFYGVLINAWLGVFNMIPVMPFDGRKVWVWNKPVYGAIVAANIILIYAGFTIGGVA